MTLTYDDVCVVVPTRGDVDMQPILDALPFLDVFVADNSKRDDLAVYARYWQIEQPEVTAPVIMTIDDDVILPRESVDSLLAAYRPGHVVCNMPERFRPHYPDSALVGFGALFDRDLPAKAFERYCAHYFEDFLCGGHWSPRRIAGESIVHHDFRRTCDVVFTTLTPRILVDAPHVDREFASYANRMWKQPDHVGERVRMLKRARQVRDAVPA